MCNFAKEIDFSITTSESYFFDLVTLFENPPKLI